MIAKSVTTAPEIVPRQRRADEHHMAAIEGMEAVLVAVNGHLKAIAARQREVRLLQNKDSTQQNTALSRWLEEEQEFLLVAQGNAQVIQGYAQAAAAEARISRPGGANRLFEGEE